MMVAAGAMPPVAEKTSGVKEPISISRTHSYARLLRPSCCLYVEVRDDLQLLGARGLKTLTSKMHSDACHPRILVHEHLTKHHALDSCMHELHFVF